jgi:RNA polymerase sigma-70 factor (ECF subfamily)
MATKAERAPLVLDLFEKYYTRVYCFVRKSLPSSQAEDIAQETFTKLLEVKNLESMTISISYLIKISDNLIKRRYNKGQRFNKYVEKKIAQKSPSHDRPATHGSIQIDSVEVKRALSQLPEQEREAVRLVILEGLSYDEAANSMNVPISTLNNWKFRGLKRLKDRDWGHLSESGN